MATETTSTPINRHAIVGAGFAFVAAIGFSGKAILVKLAYRYGIDAVALLALRMAFSAPIFLAAALWSATRNHSKPVERRDWGAILVLGLLGYYLSSLFDFMGLSYISAGLERLVLFLYPTMVVLLSAAIHRRGVKRHEWIALALSYAGIALVFLHDIGTTQQGIVVGTLLVFASTLTYSMYLIGTGHVIARVGTLRFTAYAMLVASAAMLIQFALTHPLAALRQPMPVYGLSIAMALLSTVLPVFLLSAAIRRIGSGHAALIGSVGPVSTIVMAAWFLGEPVTTLQVAGAALVLAGVLTVSARAGRQRG